MSRESGVVLAMIVPGSSVSIQKNTISKKRGWRQAKSTIADAVTCSRRRWPAGAFDRLLSLLATICSYRSLFIHIVLKHLLKGVPLR